MPIRATQCANVVWSDLDSGGRLKAERIIKNPHSTELRGGACHRSAKASGGEDLQVEEPVACWDCASFHFHATLTCMLSPTLIGDQVIEVRQPCQKRLLAPPWMMVTVDGQITLSTSASKPRMRVSTHEAPQ
jgi:hypothetical protein